MDEGDEDEEEDTPKNRQAKALERALRNREGNNAYESDEEKNPYASSVRVFPVHLNPVAYPGQEEEEEEPEPVHTGPAIQPQSQQVDPKATTPKPSLNKTPIAANSGTTSPVASPTSLSGHSLIAKRATSPKVPKAKMPGASGGNRTGSPAGSRANSPTPSRATSPLAQSPTSSGDSSKNNKRKAEDSPTSPTSNGLNGTVPKPKKKRTGPAISSAELEAMLISWLKATPNATTRDCISHFNNYLFDQERKAEFSTMVKGVAILKNGFLCLRPGF